MDIAEWLDNRHDGNHWAASVMIEETVPLEDLCNPLEENDEASDGNGWEGDLIGQKISATVSWKYGHQSYWQIVAINIRWCCWPDLFKNFLSSVDSQPTTSHAGVNNKPTFFFCILS